MSNYAEKLRHPKWQKKRLQILNRDKFTCKLCKDTETTLHVHHKFYTEGADPWEYDNCDLTTLCEHCHQQIEKNKDSISDFDDVRIYKSDKWKGGARIMFLANISTGDTVMSIYDSSGKWISGFELSMEEQKRIMKIFKFACKPL